jgi:predicted nucleotidyltransferase component of viral defense system
MIPTAYINEWKKSAPWGEQSMVEQDLILSRILVDLFRDPVLSKKLIFRGGTALHKFSFSQPMRYSEDIDLVQRDSGSIGPIFDSLRNALAPWLGDKPSRKQGRGVVNLVYRVQSEDTPTLPLRIKIEINTREHFQLLPLQEHSIYLTHQNSRESEPPVQLK